MSSKSEYESAFGSKNEEEYTPEPREELKSERSNQVSTPDTSKEEPNLLKMEKKGSQMGARYSLLGECHIDFTRVLKEEVERMDRKDSTIFGKATGSFNVTDLK